ncbi:50S ribosomal protein L11 methyltransferase [Croceitalea sp. MTPC9]|uniref:50S ribosomal protein L11 methyltransferase n=1 Tax=unclassified Croceitalea TaxID=2632280 RepID=UPI002B3D4C1C|nr:50S ribosomal protein L11 methyltransferase [Croceitalea sp. MTPC6]GMN18108.1 50S ribosomal protein L11 methyltransferase [Croceitalea sp. MTPC9]
MTYLEFDFTIKPLQLGSEILIAELGEAGFESFVEHDSGFLAYIPEQDFDEAIFSEVYLLNNPSFEITWSSKTIQQQNWNSEWEKNFNPIKVNGKCVVRAPFHPKEDVKYDIVIEPKMSFGTGHHETTHMMLQHILHYNFEDKSVLDMGCGTGILAILAEMKGAKTIDAMDIDNWCYLNSLENVARNNCDHINVYEGDATLLGSKKYSIIIANINRNILLQDISIYSSCLDSDGLLFLSGFYESDLSLISAESKSHSLIFQNKLTNNSWVAAVYRKG